LNKSKSQSVRDSTTRLQQAARERADDEARRIPWQRLLDARNEYIDWQEFSLWVRSILEVENRIPDCLVEILDDRVPGFLGSEKQLRLQAAMGRPLPVRLEDWIDDHIFGFAKQEGWFNAITYYAIRDPRYQRAEVCWSECTEKWKKANIRRSRSGKAWRRNVTRLLICRPGNARPGHQQSWCNPIAFARPSLDIWIGRPLRIGLDRHWSVNLDCPRRLRAYLILDALDS